ncbi:MAG TPA: PIN domain nuclease [Gammaproteobacteria bacterium]|jgi:hypothetical protein|nr:PIN domain nuclease [Gammaproteobacteria bacterium]
MYLVDTSVWIDYLREKNTSSTKYFSEVIENKIPFGITGLIYQEIIQGALTKKDFDLLVDYLGTQYFFHPADEIQTYQNAAETYFKCRRKGLTIGSSVDCLIAQIAIENNLTLIHNDKDFLLIQKVLPSLKLIPS